MVPEDEVDDEGPLPAPPAEHHEGEQVGRQLDTPAQDKVQVLVPCKKNFCYRYGQRVREAAIKDKVLFLVAVPLMAVEEKKNFF